ncbi:odorant receptor 13a-like [Toxorhynchites rutilus septentrionalis]|uniref:odorant receptor 13a-like n=1 Tax=Toxorhynchites rutilus septentrionalis TaxID=329112 RepID=UPI00247A038C|nr:odorant receptor 13a-like [Toxorhynchites rutilus septentrionalis]
MGTSRLPRYHQIQRIIKGLEYPEKICIFISIQMLTYLGQWNPKQRSRKYSLYFHLLNCVLVLHIFTLIWDICDIYNDFILFGDSLCVILGVCLVFFKKCYHNYYSAEFEGIIEDLQRSFQENNRRYNAVTDLQRKYFVEEVVMLLCFIFLGSSLIIAVCVHSLFDRTMPVRTKYPFDLDSNERFAALFLFQLFLTVYVVQTIVFLDGLGGQVMSQIALQFNILLLDFQRVGNDLKTLGSEDGQGRRENNMQIKQDLRALIKKHQDLISFGNRVNALYEPLFSAQLISSMCMICMTALEATLTMDDFFLFMKFAVYAVSVLLQILYWSYYGNGISYISSSINEALIECNWIGGDSSFRMDLLMVMLRVQRPFRFRVHNYFSISYETFIGVVSKSYSFFTLLRTISN